MNYLQRYSSHSDIVTEDGSLRIKTFGCGLQDAAYWLDPLGDA